MTEQKLTNKEPEAVYKNIRNSIINGKKKIDSAIKENEAFLSKDIKEMFSKQLANEKYKD